MVVLFTFIDIVLNFEVHFRKKWKKEKKSKNLAPNMWPNEDEEISGLDSS